MRVGARVGYVGDGTGGRGYIHYFICEFSKLVEVHRGVRRREDHPYVRGKTL